ncbi:hypothetical protein tb265_46500 [Gemmatimonadetes bacterium T265]|nr:hypothetical protein tb265_46500 [Gemmatimonadetes bacterium T265]
MLAVGPPWTAAARAQISTAGPDSAALASPARGPILAAPAGLASAVPADTGRPHAVTYSDAYGTRLTIHRYASYATLPVFAAEYVLGHKLLHYRDVGQPSPDGTKTAHTAVALGLGALFAANTVTGVWNWWDARHDPNGRARRTVHSALMLAADAGFAAAGALAGRAGNSRSGAYVHRNVALASMGVTIGGGAMMYLWKE